MAKKKKEKLSMWERSEYDIISETETETELVAVLRVCHSGATVTCHIPKHTPEEEKKLSEDITEAMMQIAKQQMSLKMNIMTFRMSRIM